VTAKYGGNITPPRKKTPKKSNMSSVSSPIYENPVTKENFLKGKLEREPLVT
jgi:hypothetical protein